MSKERLTTHIYEVIEGFLTENDFSGMVFPKEFSAALAERIEAAIAERMPTDEDKAIRKFFIWMVQEAKIEVIDAEHAIEVHGFIKEGDMFVPVIGIDDLIAVFRSRMDKGSSEKPNNHTEVSGMPTEEEVEYKRKEAQRTKSIMLAEKYIRETPREVIEADLRKYDTPHWYDSIIRWFRGRMEEKK
jgi:hypothetical protein